MVKIVKVGNIKGLMDTVFLAEYYSIFHEIGDFLYFKETEAKISYISMRASFIFFQICIREHRDSWDPRIIVYYLIRQGRAFHGRDCMAVYMKGLLMSSDGTRP